MSTSRVQFETAPPLLPPGWSLPAEVGLAVLGWLTAQAQPQAQRSSAPAPEPRLPAGWLWQTDPLGGGALWQKLPGQQGAGQQGRGALWLQADGQGHVHVLAEWQQGELRRARFLLPARHRSGYAGAHPPALELHTGAARHPLWGRCDALRWPPTLAQHSAANGEELALLPAQDYARLKALPPLDRPGSLPPGGGAAVLNFLATLMLRQGLQQARYHGPYPTAHLYQALCRSFDAVAPSAVEALARFTSREEEALQALLQPGAAPALMADRPIENDLLWRPRPFVALQAEAGLSVHWRPHPAVQQGLPPAGTIETVWIEGAPFRGGPDQPVTDQPATDQPASEQGGCCIWTDDAAPGAISAGLRLLGQPYRVFARLDGQARVLELALPAPAWEAGPQLSAPWCEAALAWAVLQSTAVLAAAVAELAVELRWAPLPLSMAEVSAQEGDPVPVIAVQSGVHEQFRRLLAQARPPAELALMAVSDVLTSVAPVLKRLAQQNLESQLAEAGPADLLALSQAGRAAQHTARARLATIMPQLVRQIVDGWSSPV